MYNCTMMAVSYQRSQKIFSFVSLEERKQCLIKILLDNQYKYISCNIKHIYLYLKSK